MTDIAEAQAAQNDGFEWAIVEIFGHRRHVGRTREEERFGSKMLRIDVPEIQSDGSAKWASHYYGGSALFSYTPTDEATVMRYAERRYAAPPIPYQAPEPNDAGELDEVTAVAEDGEAGDD